MHTFAHGSTRIHHNQDGSGDAIIVDDLCGIAEVRVPCKTIIAFAAELVRAQRISQIEQMTAEQVLGIK